MNDPDYDDAYDTWCESRIHDLAERAKEHRIPLAEAILDAPEHDDLPDELCGTEAAAWEWLWHHRRADYRREMSERIDAALGTLDEARLIEAHTVDYGRDVPGEYDEI